MVRNKRLTVVLIVGSIIVLSAMATFGEQNEKLDEFTGLCVYSSASFSVLNNGKTSVGVYAPLEEGRVYKITGRLMNSSGELRIKPVMIEPAELDFPLEKITGAYWPTDGCYLLTPDRIRLGSCLNASKGEVVEAEGLWYGRKFYVLRYRGFGIPETPRDGMPWSVEGVVLYTGSRTVIWNGSEEIVLYLPYGTELELGKKIHVLGIAKFYSRLSLIVDSPDDVDVVGDADRKNVSLARVGDIAFGTCIVMDVGRSLRLNCTELRLYGFSARVGDTVSFEALRRKSSLYCLSCEVVKPREKLSNAICDFEEGKLVRMSGVVEWVKVYKNGFGLVNVTDGNCWVLLKLRKSLGISLEKNQTVTAYGVFTTYRDMPALEIALGDDLCSGRC